MSEQLLTIQDVVKRLQVSESTVRRMIDRGELRAIRIGRQIRIKPEDVESFIAENTEEA